MQIAFGAILRTMRERGTDPVIVHLPARMSGSNRRFPTLRFQDEDLICHALLEEWQKN